MISTCSGEGTSGPPQIPGHVHAETTGRFERLDHRRGQTSLALDAGGFGLQKLAQAARVGQYG